jgi:hypothetical protein
LRVSMEFPTWHSKTEHDCHKIEIFISIVGVSSFWEYENEEGNLRGTIGYIIVLS